MPDLSFTVTQQHVVVALAFLGIAFVAWMMLRYVKSCIFKAMTKTLDDNFDDDYETLEEFQARTDAAANAQQQILEKLAKIEHQTNGKLNCQYCTGATKHLARCPLKTLLKTPNLQAWLNRVKALDTVAGHANLLLRIDHHHDEDYDDETNIARKNLRRALVKLKEVSEVKPAKERQT